MADSTSPEPAKRKRRSHAERREESERNLIAAAIDLIGEEGVSAATLEAIGVRAGYSRALPGARFGTKQSLIEIVLARVHEQSVQWLDRGKGRHQTALDALMADIEMFFDELLIRKENRAYQRLLASTIADISPLRERFATEHRWLLERYRDLIEAGQREGRIRKDLKADGAALMIGIMMLGVSVQMLVDPATDPQSMRQAAIAMFREALSAPK